MCRARPGRGASTWRPGRSRRCAWPSTTSCRRLSEALPQAAALLAPGGRLGVISFHSGEDRIVKRTFRALAGEGYAPLEPAPIQPEQDEINNNPRARSAKLRVIERLEAA